MSKQDDSAPFMGGPGADAMALARVAGLLKALEDGDTATWQGIILADAEASAAGGVTVYQTLVAALSYAYVLATCVVDLSGDDRETVMANATAALLDLVRDDNDNEGNDQ